MGRKGARESCSICSRRLTGDQDQSQPQPCQESCLTPTAAGQGQRDQEFRVRLGYPGSYASLGSRRPSQNTTNQPQADLERSADRPDLCGVTDVHVTSVVKAFVMEPQTDPGPKGTEDSSQDGFLEEEGRGLQEAHTGLRPLWGQTTSRCLSCC